mmetsp:Transcript_31233/g.80281  ORF Transcript_31233/g.80281 Transcript_31233/m.80281 type:complete len:262 (-) Transcript_31233:395-1180(-)
MVPVSLLRVRQRHAGCPLLLDAVSDLRDHCVFLHRRCQHVDGAGARQFALLLSRSAAEALHGPSLLRSRALAPPCRQLRAGRGRVLAGAPERPERLVLPRHHRRCVPVLHPEDLALAEHQACGRVACVDVFLRHLLGLPLPVALREERHGRGGHRGWHRRDRADAASDPRHQRPSGQPADAWLRGRRPTRAPRFLLAALRHLEPAALALGLLCARGLWICHRTCGHLGGPVHHADGSTCAFVFGAGDLGHDTGAGLEAWRA